jgi:hypothetical protein
MSLTISVITFGSDQTISAGGTHFNSGDPRCPKLLRIKRNMMLPRVNKAVLTHVHIL